MDQLNLEGFGASYLVDEFSQALGLFKLNLWRLGLVVSPAQLKTGKVSVDTISLAILTTGACVAASGRGERADADLTAKPVKKRSIA